LRTPLALLSLELDQIDHPRAQRLKGDVAAMRRLIDQLMLLAQIDAAASAQIAPEQIGLVELARDVVSQVAPAILDEGKMIALAVNGEVPGIRGRKEAIAAALRNLVENAVRVTPAGGTVQVFVGPGAVMGVRDEGRALMWSAFAISCAGTGAPIMPARMARVWGWPSSIGSWLRTRGADKQP
jgi:signal transduction histidine kinase